MDNLNERFYQKMYLHLSFAQKADKLTTWQTDGVTRCDNAIYYIKDGEAEININGKNYILKKGDLCVIPVASRVSYNLITESMSKYFIHFYMNFDSIPCFVGYDFDYVTNIGVDDNICKKFDEICNKFVTLEESNNFKAQYEFFEILSLFFRKTPVKKLPVSDSEIKAWKALGYISKMISEDININKIAKHAEVHPKYLSRIFKNVFGYTVNQYVNLVKIEKAITLYAYRKVTLKEVISFVGYNDYTAFKKWYYYFKNSDIKKLRLNTTLKLPKEERFDLSYNITGVKCSHHIWDTTLEIPLETEYDYIVCIKQGSCLVAALSDSMYLKNGEAAFLGKGSYQVIKADKNCDLYLFKFIFDDVELTKSVAVEINDSDLFEKLNRFSINKDYSLLTLFQKESILMQLLSIFKDNPNDITVYKGDISMVYTYINENISQPLTVPAIAEHFSINTKKFIEFFKKESGIIPSEYISEIKLKNTIKYMKNPEYSLSDISRMVGYQSYEGFRQFIKRKCGKYPAQLREELFNSQF